MWSKFKTLGAIFLAISLNSGCSFTGYGGTTKFRCSNGSVDPLCNSISGNYLASINGTLGLEGSIRQSSQPYSPAAVKTLMQTNALSSGMPIRSQSEIARIWVAPYLDADGDLVDQSFTYVTLNEGRWLIEHNQQQIMDEYRPIRLLGTSQGRSEATTESGRSGSGDGVPDIGIDMEQIGNAATSAQPNTK